MMTFLGIPNLCDRALFSIFESSFGYSDPAGRFSDLRSFFAFFLDEDEVGVLTKDDLFKTEVVDGESRFVWRLNLVLSIGN